jgi:protoporphyrin/coproporphyrin ferrochelatase
MPFLENVTRGRGIPRERLLEVAKNYELFGGVSPINAQNRKLVAALEANLRLQRAAAAGLLRQPQLAPVSR